MPRFKHILFPVDFSAQDSVAAPHVAFLARHYGARVTMLHVMETPACAPGWPALGPLVELPANLADWEKRLDAFLQSELQDVPVKRLMLQGDPARFLIGYAEKEDVDLIMMPTHGYGPFRRYVLGSVTAKVLHDAKCPVWTTAHVPKAAAAPASYRNILCALDLTAASVALLRWASELARDHGATLWLVHAVPCSGAHSEIEGGKFLNFLFDVAQEDVVKIQKEAGTSVEVILDGGDVSAVVRQAAEKVRAEVVVIGRGVIGDLFGRMRTHVYSIVRDTPCPVISV